MSHTPERKERDCLNCGTIVQGHYCQHCGQQNIVPKETFWHMVTHFFYDITHFDSNFFHTVHHLVLKPGFLSKEYLLGRRASYLHPVKMYVFSSAIFFLLFFSLFKPGDSLRIDINKSLTPEERTEYINNLENELKQDTGNIQLRQALVTAKNLSIRLVSDSLYNSEWENGSISFTGTKYKSFSAYDSVENTLPPNKKDGWIVRRLVKKQIEIDEKYKGNPKEAIKKLMESLLHRLPYMLFISLPLFAFILKLVYIRRKQFYFADHAVFTIHLYVFTFILLMVVFALGKLKDATGWGLINLLIVILFLFLFFYLYKAMRKFYGQKRTKTFFKFAFVGILSLIMMVILFLMFMFFSAVTL